MNEIKHSWVSWLYAKYLGITISSNSKWNKHIQNMTSKANKTLGFIRRNLKINSVSIKDRAYQALIIEQNFNTGVLSGTITLENINSIEKVQRRAARYVYSNYKYTESVTNMIKTLHWPTLQERRLKSRLNTDILIKSQSNTRYIATNKHTDKSDAAKTVTNFHFYAKL